MTIGNEVLQELNTCNFIFNIPQLIASLTEVMTLEPGDVISTGTPPGVGAARTPKRWMLPGETVTITIDKVGNTDKSDCGGALEWRRKPRLITS